MSDDNQPEAGVIHSFFHKNGDNSKVLTFPTFCCGGEELGCWAKDVSSHAPITKLCCDANNKLTHIIERRRTEANSIPQIVGRTCFPTIH